MNRMQFLRGKKDEIRPPWSVMESRFTELCSRCDDCASACDEHIISKGRGGFPVIDFQNGECFFCGDCVQKCSSGALQADQFAAAARPWNLKAVIKDNCLNFKGVVCRSCGDRCAERALRFRPVVGGRIIPELDLEICNGCGACVAPCPVQAVSITSISNKQTKQKSHLEDCA